MSDDKQPISDAEAQAKEILESLTPEKLIQNDLDTAKTPREFRKIAQNATLVAMLALKGSSGMSQEEKVEALTSGRDRLLLAVEALNKGIDLALAKDKEETE